METPNDPLPQRTPNADTRDESGDDPIESLVARCLALGEGFDEGAIERVCEERPEHLDAVRRRLEQLAHFGLLEKVDLSSDGPRFRDYELLEELGSGGMGVVWLARDKRSGRGDRLIALKTADPRVPWTDRMRERFRREVSAASRLAHPHIVSIDDVGEEHGLPYYTMEYIEGPTLAELIAVLKEKARDAHALRAEDLCAAWQAAFDGAPGATPAAPERWGTTYVQAVCRMLLDIAGALSHAHAHGVVHRDVKPANILVDREGRAHLFDLGLAHLSDLPALTLTADFAGSPHYASPEQISGSARELDGRTDVYSLGVTLFEAFALRPPFQAANTPQLLRAIQQQEAPLLRSISPVIPRDLETLCQACLEKKSEHRFSSASEFAADLARFLRFEPVLVRPPGRLRRTLRRARRNPALAVAISLAAALVIALPLALWRHESQLRDERDRAGLAAAEARREAEENRQVSSFLESIILYLDESGDAEHRRTARDLVELASERAEGSLDLDATTRASLLTTVASVLGGMGRAADAIPLLDRAYAIRCRELGVRHTATTEVLRRLAESHASVGNRPQARALALRCLEAVEDAESANAHRARARVTLARILREDGDATEAGRQLEDAAREFAASPEAVSVGAAQRLREQGELELGLGRPTAAIARLEESRAMLRGLSPTPFDELAHTVDALARARRESGELDGACALWREALALLRKRAGDRSPHITAVLLRLTRAEAESASRGSPNAPTPLERARHLALLGSHLTVFGSQRTGANDAEARRAYEEAIELLRGVWVADSASDNPVDATRDGGARAELGACLVALADLHLGSDPPGRAPGRALRLAQEARALAEPTLARPWELRCLQLTSQLGAGRATGASADLERVTERLHAWEGPVDESVLRLFEEQARLLGARGRWRDATELLELAARATSAPIPSAATAAPTPDLAPFERLSQLGITALQAGRADQAAEAFRRCLELRPTDSVAAYNLACSHALAGHREAALDAFERAADNGFGHRDGAIENAAGDSDLALLHDEPRFRETLARMRALADAATAYAFDAELYVPPALAGARSVPLIVLLHGSDETKEAVVAGTWRAVADRLGYALLAPGGRIPAPRGSGDSGDSGGGTRWAESLEDYSERSLFYEEPVRVAFSRLREEHDLEPERVFIVGTGIGGALAFNTALGTPELVRGAILIDAELHDGLAAEKAPHLGSMGFRAALITTLRSTPPGDQEVAASLRASSTFLRLRDWGIRTTMGSTPARMGQKRTETFVQAVRWLEGLE